MVEDVSVPNRTTENGAGNGPNTTKPEYIAFILVPTFFLLGLLGVLVCHLLKRKGYRCTTEAEEAEVMEEEKHQECAPELNETFEGNNDTVGQIVQFIMQNEANTEALHAMVPDNTIDSEVPGTPTSPTSPAPSTPQSPGAPPGAAKHTCNHLHTVGGVSGHKNICTRCNEKKWPLVRRSSRSRTDRKGHAGEVTVLSVGRFRVTKCDPKSLRERRALLVTDSKDPTPTTPTEAGPMCRTSSGSKGRGSDTQEQNEK